MAKLPKGVRLEEEVIKEIEKQAKKEKRKFNAMLDIILDEWLQKNKSGKGNKKGDLAQ